MELSEVNENLTDLVVAFHNRMVREGGTPRTAEQWFDEFLAFLPDRRQFAEACALNADALFGERFG